MRKNVYKLLLFSFFISLSKVCFAVNLGEIEVISKPNQAFLANIELLSYTKGELDGLKIKNASNKEYQKFGIERNVLLNKLKFSIEGREADGLYVQVHAAYLAKDFPGSFLLEVSWPDGQMIKQYNISSNINNDIDDSEEVELLHKQFQAAIDAVIKADDVSSSNINQEIDQQIKRLKNKQHESVPLVEKFIKTPSGGIEYSSVEAGESVSKIAQLLTTNKKVSVDQVMVALFNENRDAFIDNNIHRLRIGARLKIENKNSITSISKEEASRLAQQYMNNPGARIELEDPLIAGNAFSENMIKSSDEHKVIKRLEILSESEGFIPQDVLKRIKAEELAKSEEEIRIANDQLQALQSKIAHLKKRVRKLENNSAFNENNLFLENIDLPTDKNLVLGNTATVQEENLLITSTGLSLEEKDSVHFMQNLEKHKTMLFFGLAALLSISLLGFRHRTWFSTFTQRI